MDGSKESWQDAENNCRALGGDLLSIESKGVKDFITKKIGEMAGTSTMNWWIGLKLAEEPADWRWYNGHHLDTGIIKWGSNEPKPDTPPACATVQSNGVLLSQACDVQKKYICERYLGKPPTCAQGWTEYGDYCYKNANGEKHLDFWGARQACQDMGADLPIIDNSLTNFRILTEAMAIDGDSDTWIGIKELNDTFVWVDNTPVSSEGYINWMGEGQPQHMNGSARGAMIIGNDGIWETRSAGESLTFLCQKKAGTFCFDGMKQRGKMCYTFEVDPNFAIWDWHSAKNECMKFGMNLPTLFDNKTTEWYNDRLVSYINTDSPAKGFWIGLIETEPNSENFIWVDGSNLNEGYDSRQEGLTYNKEQYDCMWFAPCKTGDEECSPISSPDNRWINDVCESNEVPHFYGCEIQTNQLLDLTNIVNDKKYCPDGWTLYADFCYKVGDSEETWSKAGSWCKMTRHDSDLVSVHSKAENDFVSNFVTTGGGVSSWIGLNVRGHDWEWSDGTNSYEYKNWAKDEPVDENTKKCALVNKNNGEKAGKWITDNCLQQRNFVCKVEAYNDVPGSETTTPSPNDPNCGHGGSGWREDPITGMCYLLLDTDLAWEDAREECASLSEYRGDGDLASINSFEEESFIMNTLGGPDSWSRWIGLSDQSSEKSFVWSDYTPVAYVNWRDGEPNNVNEEDCVQMYMSDGTWNDAHCGDKRASICERKGYNYKPMPSPTPPQVTCAPGWKKFGEKCFYFGMNETIGNYSSGVDMCHSLNSIATLASIHSKAELDWIIDGRVNQRSFIGAVNIGSKWSWADGSPWAFENWGSEQPDGGSDDICVVMELEPSDSAGWWNDVPCNQADSPVGYICSYLNFVCPPHWTFFDNNCWYSSSSTDTFDGARKTCQDEHLSAELASVHNAVDNWLLTDMEQVVNSPQSWIGLQGYEDSWRWTDGTPTDFTDPWDDSGKLSDNSGKCAVLNDQGTWVAYNCSSQQNYDCKFAASSYYGCPLGWEQASGFCYLLQDTILSWEDADTACKKKGGHLVSIQSFAEHEEVYSLLHSGPNCPEGYLLDGSNCILVVDDKLPWGEASDACHEMGAELFMVKSAADQQLLVRHMNGKSVWLGGARTDLGNPWMWNDGTNFTYSNWKGNSEGNIGLIYAKQPDYGWKSTEDYSASKPYVCRKPQGSDKAPRWIGLSDKESRQTFKWSDGNPVIYTKWGTGMPNTHGEKSACGYINSLYGGWKHSECSTMKSSVCKMNSEITGPPPDDGCLQNEVAYRGSCYSLTLIFADWNTANDKCNGYGGHLVSIESDYEQAKITTWIAELDVHFYLGLQYNNDTQSFEWSSGEEFVYSHWAEFEPDLSHHDQDGSGYCAYMHRHEDIGFWKVVQCSEQMASICEFPRQGYTEPPTTTVTVPPEAKCPNDYDWYKYNDHCYRIYEEAAIGNGVGLNFAAAADLCETQGGHLATFGDYDEELNVYMTWNTYGYWIGLRQEISEDGEGYTWIDETPFDYQNWAYDFPNSQGGRENCIAKDLDNNYSWKNFNCEESLGAICETVAGIDPVTTAAAPTAPPRIPCGGDHGDEWIQRPRDGDGDDDEDFCYAVYADWNSQLTFRQAEKNCTAQGAHLVSLHSDGESYFVRGVLDSSGQGSAWIGFTSLNLDEGFGWMDGSPADYVLWASGEPNNAQEEESCTNIDARNGYWNDAHCSNLASWVCKKPREGEFTTAETTPFPAGHCPQDWLEFEGRCYKVIETLANWTMARDTCVNMAITRSHTADLASIHSPIQTAFLVAETAFFNESAYWIGFNSILSWEGQYQWCDETDTTYTNWARDEPNGMYTGEQCATMYSFHSQAGEWNDVTCDSQYGFICEIRADQSIPTQSPDWNPCQKQELADQGFIQLSDNCYKFDVTSKSWNGAEDSCKAYGERVHLASVRNVFENDLMLVLSNPEDYWIGLSQKENTWTWTDGWEVEYTNWNENQDSNDSCAFFNHSALAWNKKNCIEEMSFVCKYSEDDPPTRPPPGPCPEGWFHVEATDRCYQIFEGDYGYTFDEASKGCFQTEGTNGKHAELVSIHSEEESIELLQATADYAQQPAFWIGLMRSGVGWDWIDKTPYDFTYWNEGEPNNADDLEDCAEAVGVNFKWNDVSCDTYKSYICVTESIQTTPVPETTVPSENPTETTGPSDTPTKTTEGSRTTETRYPTETTPRWTTQTTPDNQGTTQDDGSGKGGGLSGGATAAIVIIVLLVGTVGALMVVQLRRNDWDLRRALSRGGAPLLGGGSSAGSSSYANMSYRTGANSVEAS